MQIDQLESENDGLKPRQLFSEITSAFKYLIKYWFRIGIVCLIGGIIGFLIATFSKPTYAAYASFILEEGKSGSGFSSLAGQFGLDLGSLTSGGSSMLAGDNILGLLRSDAMIEEALLSPYDGSKTFSLADKYAEVYELRKAWQKNETIAKEIYFTAGERKKFSRVQDSLLKGMVLQMKKHVTSERPDKKMTFINVTCTTRDERLSKAFVEKLINNSIEFYINTKTQRQRNNVDRLQRRADSIARLLNQKTYSSASAQSKNIDINPMYQTATVSAELVGRDKIMIGTIYTEVVKNLEIQKASLTQETPVLQLVDTPYLPLKRIKKGRVRYTAIGLFLGGLVITSFLLLKKKK